LIDAHGNTQIVETGKLWKDTFERLTSRKFMLTAFVQGIGAIGFMKHLMDGGTYIALSTLVLSSYSAASIADKKLNGGQ
jgi:hypothetical protein